MPTYICDPAPAEFEALLERRRRWGADIHDEMWKGVLHLAPAAHGRHADLHGQLLELLGPLARANGLRTIGDFNLGDPEDYRVPDGGLRRSEQTMELWNPTAPLVIEILSPGDESWKKLGFYADHDVDELLIVDPAEHSVTWLGLANGEYRPVTASSLIELGPAELTDRLDWPA